MRRRFLRFHPGGPFYENATDVHVLSGGHGAVRPQTPVRTATPRVEAAPCYGFRAMVQAIRPPEWRAEPPASEAELLARAAALEGILLGDLAQNVGTATPCGGVHTKGKVGTLVERALGATGGSSAVHDFPHLGIELKTIPVNARGKPRESTFVATLSLADADYAEWETSWVRAKLACVLWIPIETGDIEASRRVGVPRLWRPSPDQERVLRDDFDEIMGIIGIGAIESLTARTGTWLQVRPKAAHGGVRTRAVATEHGYLETVPRGFYLRASFTESLL